jgi:hypothetical protein
LDRTSGLLTDAVKDYPISCNQLHKKMESLFLMALIYKNFNYMEIIVTEHVFCSGFLKESDAAESITFFAPTTPTDRLSAWFRNGFEIHKPMPPNTLFCGLQTASCLLVLVSAESPGGECCHLV